MIKNKGSLYHDKDSKRRISPIKHIEHYLKLIKSDEEIKDQFLKGKNLHTDHTEKTVSNKIHDIENETQDLREKYDYLKALEKKYYETVLRVINALDYNNEVFEKEYGLVLSKPDIVEIKKLDGIEELSTLRKKANNNEEFSEDDCALLEALPEMNFKKGTDMEAIIEELYFIIKKANINESEKDKLLRTMYYTIDYYIEDEDKKIKLMNEFEMKKAMISQSNSWLNIWKKRGIEKGIKIYEEMAIKKIVLNIYKDGKSPEEISELCDLPISQVNKFIYNRENDT